MLAGYDHLLRAAQRLRWEETTIDLAADREAALALPWGQRDQLERLIAGFCVAESAVAEHLAPFAVAAADDDLLAACFAAQADDEARHARFFVRVAQEVLDLHDLHDVAALAGPGVAELFGTHLPRTATALASGDASLHEAVGLYHLVLEGLAFSAGQDVLLELLDAAGTLPGVREGVARVQGDERWHLGLGVRCLADLGLTEGDLELGDLPERALDIWGADVDRDLLLRRHRRRLQEVVGVGVG